jgi:long-subunit fatty acid transport protein
VIYKPVDFLRLGLAVHSPTFYNVTSDFSTAMDAVYDNPPPGASGPPSAGDSIVSNENAFRTPWKLIGSLGLRIKQYGLLSMDYERLDYSNMRLSGDESDGLNDAVKSGYQPVNNFRFGAEAKLKCLYLRAGLGLYGSPEKGSKGIAYKTYSGGIGYTGKSFYCDFAYTLLQYTNQYTLYQYVEKEGPTWANEPQVADIQNYLGRFVATIGFRF